MPDQAFYPPPITSLPKADLAYTGATGYLLQGLESQLVFFELPAGVEVPAHRHCAQWGVILEGEIELTFGGKTYHLKKGDTYFIPEGEVHSARLPSFCRALDVFFDPARYRAKEA